MGELKTKLMTQGVESEEDKKKRLEKQKKEEQMKRMYNPIQQLTKVLYD